MLEIEIQQGDITKVPADAIVNPANCLGWMGGGSASAIKNAGGKIIEDEVVSKAPLEIGRAVATCAGKLPLKAVIHAPTMETPAEKAMDYNVEMAVRGALLLADDQGFKTIAMPGMGTGVGEFPKDKAAKIMIAEIKKLNPINLEKVVLIDLDEKLVNEWQKELNKK
ncbi:MAG: O-acetyl-ADP-ribose deacetylase [Candidatus Buchananbacteria bacterium RBG_13_39_9]|uniref:O-acetyl-ADP-ribose deacetylase n=1 Tax=Candidatus Buchananbacteria bacterium RBG_13_39_9 TaxID=1797531 RepID=A0A1G1XNG4_9BACT|nr:MAG: O-acetyl-ADP-ribose deacetylase [Candidatus Buchananbacteria bacterium RBG_13_39_9]